MNNHILVDKLEKGKHYIFCEDGGRIKVELISEQKNSDFHILKLKVLKKTRNKKVNEVFKVGYRLNEESFAYTGLWQLIDI